MPGQVYAIHVPILLESSVNSIQDHRRADCTYSGNRIPPASLTPMHRLNPTNTQQPTSNVTSPMVFLIRPRKASRLHTQTAACLVRVYCYNTRRIPSCNSVTDAWHFAPSQLHRNVHQLRDLAAPRIARGDATIVCAFRDIVRARSLLI